MRKTLALLSTLLAVAATRGAGPPADWTMTGYVVDGQNNALTAAGDVNDDGFQDLIVGSPYEGNKGAVYLYFGSRDGLTSLPGRIAVGDRAGASLGYSVAAGDVNGDGVDDVIAGAPCYSSVPNQYNFGAIFIFLGIRGSVPSPTSSWMVKGTRANAMLGWSVAAANVNGDPEGISDVVAGAPGTPNEDGQDWAGAVSFYYGRKAALPAGTPDRIAVGSDYYAQLGWSLARAGDVNADGIDDIIAGAPYYIVPGDDVDTGAVYIFYGGDAASLAWMVYGQDQVANFGLSVCGAGDVDGDGIDDIAIGAPYEGEDDRGAVRVYRGRAGGPSTSPDWTITGDQAGAGMGWFVGRASLGNGDLRSGVAVGAPGASGDLGSEGAAFIYQLDPGMAAHKIRGLYGIYSGSAFGSTILAFDANGDGAEDLEVTALETGSYTAAVFVWYDQPSEAPSNLSQWSAGTSTPVTRGGVIQEGAIRITAFLDDREGAPGRLEVEVLPTGAAFDGTTTAWAATGPESSCGSTAEVNLSGLPSGHDFHWRARIVDPWGRPSAWTRFGSTDASVDFATRHNTPPSLAWAQQLRLSTRGPVPAGARIADDGVEIRARLADPEDAGVLLELEVRPVGTSFDGSVTHRSDWSQVSGEISIVLPLPPGSYHWQARGVDASFGEAGPTWTSFGGNPESEADFTLDRLGGSAGPASCQGSALSRFPALVVGAVFLLLAGRR